MESILFRGAKIMNFDVRQSQNGEALFVRIHVRADWTDTVREAMHWEDLPEGFSGADLKGELHGIEMIFKPAQKELDKYGFKMPIKEAKDFQVVCLKQGEDEADERELKFTILTTARRAYVTLGNCVEYIGKALGQLKISYEEEQPPLPGVQIPNVQITEEQRKAASEDED